ncbi:MAG: TetR/AcrR family transcriptional regulator [Acutalibacteraceae bacterium]
MGRERQQQKNAETRNAIINAAIEIGLEEGFDELSIRKITDKLGYSVAIVYHYFKDKQEILNTIHNQTSMELMESVKACIKPERSFEKNCKIVYKMISEILVYHPDTFKLIFLNQYSPNNESIKPWLNMIKQSIEYGKSKGELREVDSEILSYILLDAFVVNQMIINEKENITNERVEEIFLTELDIILNGIIKK